MPGGFEVFDAAQERRGGGGDVGEELADRNGIRKVSLAAPSIAGKVADSAGGKPLGSLGEGSSASALGVRALAHRAKFHPFDEHRRPIQVRANSFFVNPEIVLRAHERLEPRDGFGGLHAALAVDFQARFEFHGKRSAWRRDAAERPSARHEATDVPPLRIAPAK